MTELTDELIVDQHSPHDVQISPDGNQVAYTVAPLSKKKSMQPVPSGLPALIMPERHGSSPRERHMITMRAGRLTADNWLSSLTEPNVVPPSSISSPLMGEKRWR